jgi:hypothetical protein
MVLTIFFQNEKRKNFNQSEINFFKENGIIFLWAGTMMLSDSPHEISHAPGERRKRMNYDNDKN